MKLICVLLTAFALGTTPAFADPVEPKIIPKCSLAGDLCGYTLGEWKLVLKADAELFHLRERLKKELVRSSQLSVQNIALQGQVTAYKSNQDVLGQRNKELTEQLIELDRKYQNERVKPRWGDPLAWTAAGIATSLLAGFFIKDLLD